MNKYQKQKSREIKLIMRSDKWGRIDELYDAVIGELKKWGNIDKMCEVGEDIDEHNDKLNSLYPWRPYPVKGYADGLKEHVCDMSIADMYPPSQMYITMPPRNGKSLYRHILNAVYGKSPDPTIQLQLYAALMKGENNMPTRNESNIAALAAAFRNIDRAFNRKLPDIKNVIFSGPCTIVLWEDGTKTVVRCNNDVLDPEKGLAMAIAKKAMGTNKSGSNYYDIFKKWLPKAEEEEVD